MNMIPLYTVILLLTFCGTSKPSLTRGTSTSTVDSVPVQVIIGSIYDTDLPLLYVVSCVSTSHFNLIALNIVTYEDGISKSLKCVWPRIMWIAMV
ncbi:uncharacterized protein ARMOST_18376 [Armillaria ostoyae]|uniref:Uncharacterized protein n=1 Tax=Armillaria ostoyae TaxID=47428 RepID=A0A284S1L6_ARMOS|nr:uncharacterized protein ARMOST_18376 [Armillaria ostoyae]